MKQYHWLNIVIAFCQALSTQNINSFNPNNTNDRDIYYFHFMREVTEAQSQYLTISIKSEKEKSLWVFQREYYLLPLLSREFFTRSWRSKRGWGRYCYVEVTIKRATILALGEQKKKSVIQHLQVLLLLLRLLGQNLHMVRTTSASCLVGSQLTSYNKTPILEPDREAPCFWGCWRPNEKKCPLSFCLLIFY